jgi:hypothetical protein
MGKVLNKEWIPERSKIAYRTVGPTILDLRIFPAVSGKAEGGRGCWLEL